MNTSARYLAAVVLAAGVPLIAACSSSSISEPNVDCDSYVGTILIALQPEPTGPFSSYEVTIGDSVQVVGSLQRVTAAAPSFHIQGGWTCVTTATAPVVGTVIFTTANTDVIELRPNWWIRGLSAGLAIVSATSPQTPFSQTFGVTVTH